VQKYCVNIWNDSKVTLRWGSKLPPDACVRRRNSVAGLKVDNVYQPEMTVSISNRKPACIVKTTIIKVDKFRRT